MRIYGKLIIFFVLLNIKASAFNDNDTQSGTDTAHVNYFYDNDFGKFSDLHEFSNSLDGFQRRNRVYNNCLFPATFSNPGLPFKNMIFFPTDDNLGIDIGNNSLSRYLYTSGETRYYKNTFPFSYLFYTNGSKKEQIFNVIHSQTLKKRLNIGVDYQIIHSPGTYSRQKSDNSNLILTSYYWTKNKRYAFIANYIHNKTNVQENGGILNDTLFENDKEFTDRILVDINLSGASNMLKVSDLYFKQYFNLNRNRKSDTAAGVFINLGSLSHTFSMSKKRMYYEDTYPNSGFYPMIYYPDSVRTLDSICYRRIDNTFEWSSSRFGDTGRVVELNVGVRHSYAEYFNYYIGTKYFHELIPLARLSVNLKKDIYVDITGEYAKWDYNDGDYEIKGKIRKIFSKAGNENHELNIGVSYSDKKPDYLYNHYNSNHFMWDYDFLNSTVLCGNFDYSYRGWNIGGNYYNIDNFLYYDFFARPKQLTTTLEYINVYLNKCLRYKNLGFDNKLVYQKVFNVNVLRVPEFMSISSVYYHFFAFSKALELQTGFDVLYNTAYYADAYMPATRQFYLQNDKKTGDYPYFDYFINAKIKRARFFVKVQHLNSGLSGYRYYTVPGYPMQDRMLKLGISWTFYD